MRTVTAVTIAAAGQDFARTQSAPLDAQHWPAGTLGGTARDGVTRLLELVAHDFVPPLTVRSSTTQTDLRSGTRDGVDAYADAVVGQDNIVLSDGQAVVALLSWRPRHALSVVPTGPCAYVSTVVTDPRWRRRGLAGRLYAELFARVDDVVALRTWSTNVAHLALLTSLGFTVAHRIVDDRGPGIDTVYLTRTHTASDD